MCFWGEYLNYTHVEKNKLYLFHGKKIVYCSPEISQLEIISIQAEGPEKKNLLKYT
jgi:hypothetical protein